MSRFLVSLAALGGFAGGVFASDPWADQVVSYVPGAGIQPGYNLPGSALGEPTRFAGVGVFPGAVTPFNPPYLANEIVSIGQGGHLVLRFDEPVTNDAANPFGIDLIIFGNTGYIDGAYPAGVVAGIFGAGGGAVEVSADGFNWFVVPGVADGPFPTLGYADLTDPYSPVPGLVNTDFTRPVDPMLAPTGMTFVQLVSAYNGSGGGTGIDIAGTGLGAISYVRITAGAGATVEIDAVADVTAIPAPGAAVLLGLLLTGARRSRRTAAELGGER